MGKFCFIIFEKAEGRFDGYPPFAPITPFRHFVVFFSDMVRCDWDKIRDVCTFRWVYRDGWLFRFGFQVSANEMTMVIGLTAEHLGFGGVV